MKQSRIALVLGTAFVTLSALPSAAQPATFPAQGGMAQSQTIDADTPRESPLKRGSTVNNAARANQHAPGDAKELAPDTKQSATGGPAGGYGRGGAAGGN